MAAAGVSENKDFDYVQNDEYHITASDMVAHMQRVEMLCDLVTAMMKAMVNTPFGAMLPPDVIAQVRSLG